MQSGGNWKDSHVTTFSGLDSSYSLPDNVAIITLQVCIFHLERIMKNENFLEYFSESFTSKLTTD